MITVMLKKSKIIETVKEGSIKSWQTLALCPNIGCGGIDSCYMVDDLTHHRCDKCGCKWSTYDPYNSVEACFNIKLPKSHLPNKR
jgi:hypothetical protein